MSVENSCFDSCMRFVLKWEGDLSDDEYDRGGLTKHGVSMAFLKDMRTSHPDRLRDVFGTTQVDRALVRSITKAQASRIFRLTFWDPYRLDELPDAVALCLFDMNVNHGARNSARIAQRACNAELDPDVPLILDGRLGPLSRSLLARMGTKAGVSRICSERRAFYERLCDAHPEYRDPKKGFHDGWINRANDLEKVGRGMVR